MLKDKNNITQKNKNKKINLKVTTNFYFES
jgi:hypothetical protein